MDDILKLKSIPLFSDMDEQELSALRSIMEPQSYVPGQTIIHEGEEGQLFHIIVGGHVEYVISDAQDNPIVLGDAGPGGFFGELSMITGEPRAVRVRAIDAVETLTLERDDFHNFLIKNPHAGIDVLTVLGRRLYQTDKLLKNSVPKSVNTVFDSERTFGQKIADTFASIMGSWSFIICQSVILILWITLNIVGWYNSWDPYPFILLNLALSFQAAYSAPIIMMSQNRQSDKDRLAAELDHEVNIRAEIKTGLIMNRLDELERAMHELHNRQIREIAMYNNISVRS